MVRRQTKQRKLVMEAVVELDCHPTAEDVFEHLRDSYPDFSVATVYRNLNVLVEEGRLKRIKAGEGPDHFDYIVRDHSHLLCRKCSRLVDLDIPIEINGIRSMIGERYGYTDLSTDIVISGICPECKEN